LRLFYQKSIYLLSYLLSNGARAALTGAACWCSVWESRVSA
jgi:hypothetical protein